MQKIDPFEKHLNHYEQWFLNHPLAYLSEIKALQALLPKSGEGVEIGVGTERFAAPLKIRYGVEPAAKMAALDRKRQVDVSEGTAERLVRGWALRFRPDGDHPLLRRRSGRRLFDSSGFWPPLTAVEKGGGIVTRRYGRPEMKIAKTLRSSTIVLLLAANTMAAEPVPMCKQFPRQEAEKHLKENLSERYGSNFSVIKTLLDAGMQDYDYLCSLPNTEPTSSIMSRLTDQYYPNFSVMRTLYDADMKAYMELQE